MPGRQLFFLIFFQCYYPHRSRGSVCGIFFNKSTETVLSKDLRLFALCSVAQDASSTNFKVFFFLTKKRNYFSVGCRGGGVSLQVQTEQNPESSGHK